MGAIARALLSAALAAQTSDQASSQVDDLEQAQHGFKVRHADPFRVPLDL
jgi:hypothetical protein